MNQTPVTPKEWEVLSIDELSEESLAKKKHDEWMNNIEKSREKIPRPIKKKIKS